MFSPFDASISNWSDAAAAAGVFGILAATVSLVLAVRQLQAQSDTAKATFENIFLQEYLTLTQRLPIGALLSRSLSQEEMDQHLSEFYQYVDLSNSQAYLYSQKKIRKKTWVEWEAGIVANFQKPAFKHCWKQIAVASPLEFEDLRLLLKKHGLD